MLREHPSNGTTRPPKAPNPNNGESRKSSSALSLTGRAASSQHLRQGHHRGGLGSVGIPLSLAVGATPITGPTPQPPAEPPEGWQH